MTLGALVVWLALPQTRWIAPAMRLVQAEQATAAAERTWGDPNDPTATIAEILFGAHPVQVDNFGRWVEAAHLRELRKTTLVSDAVLVRLACQRLTYGELGQISPKLSAGTRAMRLAVAATVHDICSQRAPQEPENAYWHLIDAVTAHERGDQAAQDAAIDAAAKCMVFSSHVMDEAEWRYGYLSRKLGAPSASSRLTLAYSILLPDVASYLSLARVSFVTKPLQVSVKARESWSRIGTTMARSGDSLVSRSVGRALCQYAVSEPWEVIDGKLHRIRLEDWKRYGEAELRAAARSVGGDGEAFEEAAAVAAIDPASYTPGQNPFWFAEAESIVNSQAPIFTPLLSLGVALLGSVLVAGLANVSWIAQHKQALAFGLAASLALLVNGPLSEENAANALPFLIGMGVATALLGHLSSRGWRWALIVLAALPSLVVLGEVLTGAGTVVMPTLVVWLAMALPWLLTLAEKPSWWSVSLSVLLAMALESGLAVLLIGSASQGSAGLGSLATWSVLGVALLLGLGAIVPADRRSALLLAIVSVYVGLAVFLGSTAFILRREAVAQRAYHEMLHESDTLDRLVAKALAGVPRR